MKLKRWLKITNTSQEAFARRVGATEGAVSRWVSENRIPRKKTIAVIKKITGGEVTAQDFYL